ncbi:hypothetical protein FACS1894166_02690 [Bacilli bacterium]|nr:hypothetical protein FACS1894166_02690 [Bacilli bacterium]
MFVAAEVAFFMAVVALLEFVLGILVNSFSTSLIVLINDLEESHIFLQIVSKSVLDRSHLKSRLLTSGLKIPVKSISPYKRLQTFSSPPLFLSGTNGYADNLNFVLSSSIFGACQIAL